MSIPYRTRRKLRNMGIIALIALLLFIIAWFCSVVFLERYVVYTREGAMLDMSVSSNDMIGEVATPPVGSIGISIYYNEGLDAVANTGDLAKLDGYYIDIDALQNDIGGSWDLLDPLGAGTPILVDLKGGYGSFYYSSTLPSALISGSVSVASVDEMIKDMNTKGFYTIARISAFRDYNFGLNHVSAGLMHVNRLGLWPDSGNCYWLDPTNETTQNWIISIVKELKNMGFDEVVLTDFRFPDSDQYVFNGDKDAALEECAAIIAKEVLTEKFTLSFAVQNPAFKLPEGRTRLYLENISATQVGATASQVTMEEKDARLVFLTATNDTRYGEYGALRPIASSTVLEAQKANAQKQQQQANAQASADAANKATEPTADAAGRFG